MQDYTTFDQTSSADWQAWMDYAADMTRYPAHQDDAAHTDYSPLQTVLRPCRNLDCANSSYALFCSEACRSEREGTEPDTDAYYHDKQSPTTLGLKALADTQHAADLAAGGFAALVCGQPAPAVAAPVAQMLPEAPAAISVKLAIAGYADCILTLRDSSESRLLDRLETLLQRFQPPVVQSPPVQETGEGWCSIHCTKMRWNPAKGGEAGWWSHKQNGQWCKGKGRKAA